MGASTLLPGGRCPLLPTWQRRLPRALCRRADRWRLFFLLAFWGERIKYEGATLVIESRRAERQPRFLGFGTGSLRGHRLVRCRVRQRSADRVGLLLYLRRRRSLRRWGRCLVSSSLGRRLR